jgi:hypothetical protein
VAKEFGDPWADRQHFKTKPIIGYGDITPVSQVARWLPAMEAMTGLLYVAVLIARLVSLYSTTKSDDS